MCVSIDGTAVWRLKPEGRQSQLRYLLQRCSSMKQLKQLQAQVTEQGLILSDKHILSSLVAFCSLAPSGDLSHGRQLLDAVSFPSLYMYNTLIRGYSNSSSSSMECPCLLRRLMAQGFSPNNFTFPFLLKSLSEKQQDLLLLLHTMVFKTGFASQAVVMNALLHAYVLCGHLRFARKVFDEIPQKSIVSWNSIIDGYSKTGDLSCTFRLLGAMQRSGSEPDGFTLASLLSLCARTGSLELGRVLHRFVVSNCFDDDLIVGNALIDMYGKCGAPSSAQACFDRMPARNVVSWTSLIRGYASNGLLEIARHCFDRMRERSIVSWNAMMDCCICNDQPLQVLRLYEWMQKSSGIAPDEATLTCVLLACGHTGSFTLGEKIHDYIAQHIKNPSVALMNSAADMYAKCGRLDLAHSVFAVIERKNTVSWNVLIGASAANGNALDAIELFEVMTESGFFPDSITFVGLLSACSHGGLLEHGQHYFGAMDAVYNVKHEIEHYACMVDLFGRKGYLDRAVGLIGSMPMRPDVVIWGALLGACRIHGDVKIGQQVMKQMLELEPGCSSGLFVLMSNLFCETRKWDDAEKLRKVMNSGGVRKVEGRSLIEIDGKIHEFLVEDGRHESSSSIYFLVDQLMHHLGSLASLFPNTWGSLLVIEE